ncbi:MAG: 4Fe-4S dicluster domain-containing protein [Bacteroidales bacterium]|nr:4Fe-4S dicluster domain-containing protein [Bacteroidales bacterium]
MKETIQEFHHALKIREDVCIGCTHCMKVCPTEAIRINNGKAVLSANRCVDCGECFRSCPVLAIIIEQDDFDRIFDYKVRIALVPSVFIGQFPKNISTEQIYSEILGLGFTEVYEVEHAVDILAPRIHSFIDENEDSRPVISSFCPAVVRLIQVKFPALVENIMQLKAPLDIAAIYNKKKYLEQGYQESEIGIFYITPCAAKIAAIKSPVAENKSEVTGVINMNTLYNKVFSGIKQSSKETCPVPTRKFLSPQNILWTLTRGESDNVKGRSIAVDGIHNVMEFMERLENEDLPHFDFLEMRACDESCAGGVLISGNRFLTVRRLHIRADASARRITKGQQPGDEIISKSEYLLQHISVEKVKPRSIVKLDDDMAKAMTKMKKVHELMRHLPQVDCGSCGSPKCSSLAEDVVQGKATITQCIFVQKTLEKRNIITREESHQLIENIWGPEKMDKKWLLDL